MGLQITYYRLIVCLAILFGFGNSIHSQILDSAIYSGKEDFARKEFAMAILSSEESLLSVVLDNNPSFIIISEYDNYSLQKINEFSWGKSGEKYTDLTIRYAEYFNGDIILLSTSYNANKDIQYTWLTVLSTKGKELKNILLNETIFKKRNYRRTFELFKSASENHLGVSVVSENLSDNTFEIELNLLDGETFDLEQNTIYLPNIKKVDYPSNFIVSDRGFVFFLNGLTDKKNETTTELGLEKRLYQLFRYDSQDGKLKQYDVSIADKYISDVKMKLHSNGDLYILGFYNNSFYRGTEGIFLMVIDKDTGKIKLSGKKALSRAILADFFTEKQLRREFSIDDLYLDHIHLRENGNIVLTGEVFFINQRMITGANGINLTTSKYYNFEEVLIMELDPNLGYVQHNTIYKKQKSTNFLSSYWSYSLLENSGDLSVVFNYVLPRKKKSSVTSTSPSRTSVWVQRVFSSERTELNGLKNLKVCPLYNPIWNSEYGILQDRSQYGFFKLVPNN